MSFGRYASQIRPEAVNHHRRLLDRRGVLDPETFTSKPSGDGGKIGPTWGRLWPNQGVWACLQAAHHFAGDRHPGGQDLTVQRISDRV